MEIKIKIKNVETLEIELLQDAKKGDVINILECLKSENSDFKKKLDEQIENLSQNIIDKKISENTQNLKKDFELKLQKNLNEKNNEISKKQNEIDNLNKNMELVIKNEIYKNQNEIEDKYKNKINKLENQISLKQNEIDNLNKNTKVTIENEILKSEQKLKLEHLNKIEKLKEEYNKKLEELDEENKKYKRERNMLGTKHLGNELENFCEQKIKEQLIDVCCDNTINLKKYTADDIHSEKADFIITLSNNQKTSNDWIIVLEMKTENENSDNKNKKTNEQHIQKLIKDAKRKKAQIAILVTELEREDKFLFRRWTKSDNELEVYIVRPDLLVYLLSCIRILFLKFSYIENYNFDFRKKEEILNNFNDFKKDIFENQIKNINNNLIKIEENANKISESADNILKSIKIVMDTHFSALKNKIENFNIEKKIIKKLENIDQ